MQDGHPAVVSIGLDEPQVGHTTEELLLRQSPPDFLPPVLLYSLAHGRVPMDDVPSSATFLVREATLLIHC
jgi:hypothetical protein